MWQRVSHSPDRGSVTNHRICCSESLLIPFGGYSTCFDSDCLTSSRHKSLPAFRADSLGSALHAAQRSFRRPPGHRGPAADAAAAERIRTNVCVPKYRCCSCSDGEDVVRNSASLPTVASCLRDLLDRGFLAPLGSLARICTDRGV